LGIVTAFPLLSLLQRGRLISSLGEDDQLLIISPMRRYQLGSRLLWVKGLAIGLYLGLEWWLGFAKGPMEKTAWGAVLVALILWWSAEPVGYADEEGIHYRRLIRGSHARWQDVTRAEWSPEDMILWITIEEEIIGFRYRGIAPMFGSRQRPEAVNFIERRLSDLGSRGRFVCKTSLAS
jgi:hypothetical protein